MNPTALAILRNSLWAPILVSAAIALFWLWLCVAMGFEVWMQETNWAGRLLQAALVSNPIMVYLGYRASARKPQMELPMCFVAWALGLGALAFINA